jgi:hypothetical protein
MNMRIILSALLLLLLGCEERQECDATCELLREDFELLTAKVDLWIYEGNGRTPGFERTSVNIEKTPTGAIAWYTPWGYDIYPSLSIELSMEEWQGFIKSLYKYIRKGFDNSSGRNVYKINGDTFTRKLFIFSTSGYEPVVFNPWKTGPSDSSDWNGVDKLMSDMVAKIREKAKNSFEDKIRADYKERFGEPISDFELSTKTLVFWKRDSSDFDIIASKTETGAYAKVCDIEAELSAGEWLDFVRALRKSGVGEMEKKYGEPPAEKKWGLDIYSSGRLDFKRIKGFGAYPPNWDGLEKTMEDMAKIIKKRGEKKW